MPNIKNTSIFSPYLRNSFIKEKIPNWKEIYTYLTFKNILVGAINRVVEHSNNANKKRVLKELTIYCKKNIPDYKKHEYYKGIPRNTKIIAILNFNKLSVISKILLKIKKKIRS